MAKTLKLGPKAKTIQLSSPIQKLVDELGLACEQRKKYEKEEERLKTQLKSFGAGIYDGKIFVATSQERVKTFYKNELLELHVNSTLLEQCKVKSPYLKVELVRRTGSLT